MLRSCGQHALWLIEGARALSTTKPCGQPCACVCLTAAGGQSSNHCFVFSPLAPPLRDTVRRTAPPRSSCGYRGCQRTDRRQALQQGEEMLFRPREREDYPDATLSAGVQRPSYCVAAPGTDNGIKKRRSWTTRVRSSLLTKRSSRLRGKAASSIIGMKFPARAARVGYGRRSRATNGASVVAFGAPRPGPHATRRPGDP